jgi:hypothetical protein
MSKQKIAHIFETYLRRGAKDWSSDQQAEMFLLADLIEDIIVEKVKFLTEVYTCPTCGHQYSRADLLKELSGDEDSMVMLESIGQCPSCYQDAP